MRTTSPLLVLLTSAMLASLNGACTARPAYQCSTNDVCVSEEGAPGICEASGACSFVDNACPVSARRYSDGAGAGLASACVAATASSQCIGAVSLGIQYGCLVRTDGTAWCWGANDKGQLGDGTTVDRTSPTQVRLPAGIKVSTIGTGESHTCALDTAGGVWCWGDNDTHELGPGTAASLVPLKVDVMSSDTPKVPLKAKNLSVGGKHTCALVEGGNVYCWGENSNAQCGQDPATNDDVQVPTMVAGLEGVTYPAAGDEFSCALKDDKSVVCWGANTNGELGNGDLGMRQSFAPVRVSISSVQELAVGDEHACGVKNDGSLWCWGYGGSGALGNAQKADQATPINVSTANAAAASGSSFHTCAIAEGGDLACWGANDTRQLGAGADAPSVLAPMAVKLITVKLVATGQKHTCAVTTDGALWCWGDNDIGQLGLGHTSPLEASPQRVPFSCN
jgi:alpha-tubulin suppressor-like RCC1 family protein